MVQHPLVSSSGRETRNCGFETARATFHGVARSTTGGFRWTMGQKCCGWLTLARSAAVRNEMRRVKEELPPAPLTVTDWSDACVYEYVAWAAAVPVLLLLRKPFTRVARDGWGTQSDSVVSYRTRIVMGGWSLG